MSDEPKDISEMDHEPLDRAPEMGHEPIDPAPETDPRLTGRKELMPADWDEAEDGEWDDFYASPEALAEGDDLQLVVEYLNKHLEPDQMAAVERRLAEDSKFADLAAPLIFIWKIPKHIVRHPRPEGEAERGWERLQQRIRADMAAAAPEPAPAPAPDRVLWSSRRTWERIMWFIVAFTVIVVLGSTIWFDVIKPNYFP